MQALWMDRAGTIGVQFLQNNTGTVTAQIVEQTAPGRLSNWGYPIQEANITVETENMSALLRGITQKSFLFSNLSTPQKSGILQSITSRHIEIEKDPRGYAYLLIQALP